MKRKITALLAVTMIVSSIGITTYAKDQPSLFIDGAQKQLVNEIVNRNGTNLVPMREIFTLLGAGVNWVPETKTIIATKQDSEIIMIIGSQTATVNGKEKSMGEPAEIINDNTYVPLRAVSTALGYTVDWSGDSNKITISTETAPNNIDITFTQRYENDLTLEDAAEKAINANKDLKTLKNSLSDLRDTRDSLLRSLDKTTLSAANATSYSATDMVRSLISSIESLNASIEDMPYIEQMTKDGIAVSIASTFTTIKATELQIGLLSGQIALSEKSLESNKLLNDLGMLSNIDYESAKITHEQLIEKRDINERALEDAYIALNKLMAGNVTDRYNVILDNSYEPLDKDFNLEVYVTDQMGKSPKIKIAKSELAQAEKALELYTPGATVASKSYESYKHDVSAASLSYEDTKKEFDKTLRSAYNSLRDLETNIKSSELDYEKAKVSASAADVQYETGNITELQLLQLRYGMDAAEKGLEIMKYQHKLTKNIFENYAYLQ